MRSASVLPFKLAPASADASRAVCKWVCAALSRAKSMAAPANNNNGMTENAVKMAIVPFWSALKRLQALWGFEFQRHRGLLSQSGTKAWALKERSKRHDDQGLCSGLVKMLVIEVLTACFRTVGGPEWLGSACLRRGNPVPHPRERHGPGATWQGHFLSIVR